MPTITELKQQARDKRAEQEAAENAHQEAKLQEMHRVLDAAKKLDAIGEWTDDDADYSDYYARWTVTHRIPLHAALSTEWALFSDGTAQQTYISGSSSFFKVTYYTGRVEFDEDGRGHANKDFRYFRDLGEALLFAEEKYMPGDAVAQMVRDAENKRADDDENKRAAAALSPALTAWERLQDAFSEIIADAIADAQ